MILCVTLNPVLDTMFFVDEMRPDLPHRGAERVIYVAGGKGNNVAPRPQSSWLEPAHALVRVGW